MFITGATMGGYALLASAFGFDRNLTVNLSESIFVLALAIGLGVYSKR
jgi:hypothetical protein